MNETVYVYIVHSDINENNIYAEFATEEEAIEYAKRHIDELTYVDRVEVALDEEGDIIEMFDSETIWSFYDEEDEDLFEDDDDYWNQLVKEEEERKDAEGLLGDTTWFEDLDTDSLVETLEENEDIVECKECFELFPKEACTKIAIGYICPECGKIHSHEEPEFEIDSIPDVVIADEDIFKVDFPELERVEYRNDMIPEEPTPEPMPEVGPNPEPMAEPCVGPECEAPVEAPVTKEETITKLVVDEHEAIDGYEKAEIEIEANSELDEKEKEEILDTIEHIKEEEIEHIEELEELVDEVEETKAAEVETPVEEAEVLVEGSGFLGKIILDDYFKKDGERNPENKNGTGYWVDLIDPDTKESIIKPEDKKTVQKLKDAEAIATNLSKAEDGWAVIKVEGAQGWNGILELYENGKCTQDVTKKKLANLNKAWDEQETKKKARQDLDKSLGKDKKDSENIDLPNNTESEVVDTNTTVKKAKNAAAVKANREYKKIIDALKKIGIATSEISKLIQGKKPTDALKELRKLLFVESLEEHVNEEHPAIESDQVLVGTDNAVVDCEVADIITHSEDEKSLDCKGKKKPLEKPLTENMSKQNFFDEIEEFGAVEIEAGYLDYYTDVSFSDGSRYCETRITLGKEDNKYFIAYTHFSDDGDEAEGEYETYDDFDSFWEYAQEWINLEENLAEDTHAQYAKPAGDRVAAYNNALKYAKQHGVPYIYGYTQVGNGKFFALEQPIKVKGGDTRTAEQEFRNQYKRCSTVYMVYPDKSFIREGLFTKAEQEEYNMDEEGYSLDSHDQYVRCGFCDEIFTKYECVFEKDFGWLCSRCQDELRYHGGSLTIIEEPSEEQIQATLDEDLDEDLVGYITMSIGDGDDSIYYIGYDEDEAREAVDDLYPEWDDFGFGGGDTEPMVVAYSGKDWNHFNDLVKRFESGENLFGGDLAVLGYTYYRDLINYKLRAFDILD